MLFRLGIMVRPGKATEGCLDPALAGHPALRRREDLDDLGVIDAMIARRERQLDRKNKKNKPKPEDPNLSFDFSADPE